LSAHHRHAGIVHLDTSLGVLGKNLALCYTPNFTRESLKIIESRFDLIPVTKQEFKEIRVNVVALGDRRIVVKAGSDRIDSELAKRGLLPVPVPYDEVTAFPGSFRCTTMPLVRAG
jgi:N-dimethylarginine dimethylaminohydrolase